MPSPRGIILQPYNRTQRAPTHACRFHVFTLPPSYPPIIPMPASIPASGSLNHLPARSSTLRCPRRAPAAIAPSFLLLCKACTLYNDQYDLALPSSEKAENDQYDPGFLQRLSQRLSLSSSSSLHAPSGIAGRPSCGGADPLKDGFLRYQMSQWHHLHECVMCLKARLGGIGGGGSGHGDRAKRRRPGPGRGPDWSEQHLHSPRS